MTETAKKKLADLKRHQSVNEFTAGRLMQIVEAIEKAG